MFVLQLCAWVAGLAIVAPHEWDRLQSALSTQAGLSAWLFNWNIDTTPFLLLLALAPVVWRLRGTAGRRGHSWMSCFKRWFSTGTRPDRDTSAGSLRRAWLLAVVVGGASWATCAHVAAIHVAERPLSRFGDLPPAYHDEYSYLFQSRTFLAGRISFDSHPVMPQLFDQMHVVNQGSFASRYFPGAGLWMAPFLAAGNPYQGHWLAGALASMLVFWAGRELGGNGVGCLAGGLTAFSPGMGLFGNLLLAHQPAMLGLSLFLFAFLRLMRTRRTVDALLAGVGLSFAMLCRPLTAAGIALPFGVYFVLQMARRSGDCRRQARPRRLGLTCALGGPLLAGFACLYWHNRAITGDGLVTPYQQFTNTYTPRHVFGYGNVVRAERKIAAGEALTNRAFVHYDRWAENLTLARSLHNMRKRVVASWQWTLGIIPLVMAFVVVLWRCMTRDPPGGDTRWRLLLAAIVSLHAVHLPYWYVGIMHWHYVFESGPLWLLVFAGATQCLFTAWRHDRRRWMPLWWSTVAVVCLLTAYVPFDSFWPQSRVAAAVKEISWSRLRYHQFRQLLDVAVTERPALVLVEHDASEQHIDFVTNNPALGGEVLIGRIPQGVYQFDKIVRAFPKRTVYVYRVRSRSFTRLERNE